MSEKVRFWQYVAPMMDDRGCWEWAGYRDKDGYGQFTPVHNKPVRAHRYSYEVINWKIPRGLLVCHRCDNPSCVSPSHLFLGTHKDNKLDSISKRRHFDVAKNAQVRATEITHCKHGHPLDRIFNRSNGGTQRGCGTCKRDSTRRRRERIRFSSSAKSEHD